MSDIISVQPASVLVHLREKPGTNYYVVRLTERKKNSRINRVMSPPGVVALNPLALAEHQDIGSMLCRRWRMVYSGVWFVLLQVTFETAQPFLPLSPGRSSSPCYPCARRISDHGVCGAAFVVCGGRVSPVLILVCRLMQLQGKVSSVHMDRKIVITSTLLYQVAVILFSPLSSTVVRKNLFFHQNKINDDRIDHHNTRPRIQNMVFRVRGKINLDNGHFESAPKILL